MHLFTHTHCGFCLQDSLLGVEADFYTILGIVSGASFVHVPATWDNYNCSIRKLTRVNLVRSLVPVGSDSARLTKCTIQPWHHSSMRLLIQQHHALMPRPASSRRMSTDLL